MEATRITALKLKVKSKDEISPKLVNLHVEHDGVWLLDVDGAIEKSKLEEYRTTNVALSIRLSGRLSEKLAWRF